MKQNRNPVTLFSKKGARLDITLFKAKWEVVALKVAVLLKRGFTNGNCFSNFLRNCFLEVCEQQIVKDYITRTLSLARSLPPSLPPSLPQRLTKNIIFSWQQNICSEKIQRHLFADVYKKVFFFNFWKFLQKRLCLSHFLMWLQVLA